MSETVKRVAAWAVYLIGLVMQWSAILIFVLFAGAITFIVGQDMLSRGWEHILGGVLVTLGVITLFACLFGFMYAFERARTYLRK